MLLLGLRVLRVKNLLVLLFGAALAGCLLTTSLRDLTGGTAAAPDAGAGRLYSIGGTVQGLEGATMKLAKNATEVLNVTKDGPFAFEKKLADAETYIVTPLLTSDKRTCTVQRGEGHVAGADVTDIAVVCPSAQASLSNLV